MKFTPTSKDCTVSDMQIQYSPVTKEKHITVRLVIIVNSHCMTKNETVYEMYQTQGEIQLRKLFIDLLEDNIKMYLNRCEVVEVTHLGQYTVRQRASMNLWVIRKGGNSVTR